MKILLFLMLLNCLGDCAQPYFPRQITFMTDQEDTLFAIDEINQRAYITLGEKSKRETAYVLTHFPYALPDSPQSRSYVQLHYYHPPPAPGCHYGTYVGGDMGVPFTVFPLHWENDTLIEIKNYMDFQYELIHSNNSNDDEYYWYANKLCRVSTGPVYPCQEIYLKKNTEIPLRTTHIEQKIMSSAIEQIITNYKILKIGEPDQKYFDSIPKNWSLTCADEMFQIKYDQKSTWLFVDQTVEIKVSLRAAPHRINGNDTLTIQ